jgi:hypothetical protein
MKRRWNLSIWLGFLIVLAAPFLYIAVFVRFPALRDVPWTTLPIFALGIGLMARGVRRAWRHPEAYRGRIAGTILLGAGVACLAFFAYGMFYAARQLPASAGAPRIGQRAPEFTLLDSDGHPVTLGRLLVPDAGDAGHVNGVVLIFYRGFW